MSIWNLQYKVPYALLLFVNCVLQSFIKFYFTYVCRYTHTHTIVFIKLVVERQLLISFGLNTNMSDGNIVSFSRKEKRGSEKLSNLLKVRGEGLQSLDLYPSHSKTTLLRNRVHNLLKPWHSIARKISEITLVNVSLIPIL